MKRDAYRVLALSLCGLVIIACQVQNRQAPPAIEFTTVPEAAAGGSERMARIAGRVTGAGPGQQVVLYAKSGVWWVQPLTVEPFTKLAADSTWENSIHLGTEYAALLVDRSFRPPATIDALPARGGSILAVASVKGLGMVSPRTPSHRFSSHEMERSGLERQMA